MDLTAIQLSHQKATSSFLDDSINFTSGLSKYVPTSSFWYTSISSRNRFQSPLVHFLMLQEGDNQNNWNINYNISGWLRAVAAEIYKSLLFKRSGILRLKEYHGLKVALLKSFAYRSSFRNNEFVDAYWGTFPNWLKTQTPVIHITRTLECWKWFSKECKRYPQIIAFESLVSPWDVIVSAYLSLKEGVRLNVHGNVFWKNQDITAQVSLMLYQEKWNGSFFYSFLVERVSKKLFKHLEISELYYPFENNAWERALNNVFIEKASKTIRTGYVHTVVPEMSTNMFLGPNETKQGPFPNRLVFFGKTVKDLMNSCGNLGDIESVEGCALRFKYLEVRQKFNVLKNKNILVALEGVNQAATVLLLILSQALNCSNYLFTIRAHPALPFDKLIMLSGYKGVIPKNIVVSKNANLIDDLKTCEIVIYWGSTVGIEAMALGLDTIHVDLGKKLSFDPIFMHQGSKEVFRSGGQLSDVLERIACRSQSQIEKLKVEDQLFIENYFLKETPERLSAFRV